MDIPSLDGIPEPKDGFLMTVDKCFTVARSAPGYTVFELALVCLARHYAALAESKES